MDSMIEQQKCKLSEIDAHICQMIGISEHGFGNLTVAEKESLLDYYLGTLEALNLPLHGSFRQNAASKEDFEAQFLGDISYVRTD